MSDPLAQKAWSGTPAPGSAASNGGRTSDPLGSRGTAGYGVGDLQSVVVVFFVSEKEGFSHLIQVKLIVRCPSFSSSLRCQNAKRDVRVRPRPADGASHHTMTGHRGRIGIALQRLTRLWRGQEKRPRSPGGMFPAPAMAMGGLSLENSKQRLKNPN